jgi:hypothetical protein
VTLFAKNSDRPPDELQVIEWCAPRHDQHALAVTHITVEPSPRATAGTVLCRPAWCWGAEHGVNEAGVAIGNEAIYTTLDPRPAPLGLTGMDLVRLGLERADTAASAVEVMTELLERYGQGGSGHDPAIVPNGRPYFSSFLIADPREAWVLETSGQQWAAEHVTRTRAISNRTTIPSFDLVHRHPRQPVERLVDPRLNASRALLETEPVTLAAVQRHLRSHDSAAEPGWSVCMHVPGVESTTASMIAELPEGPTPPTAWMVLGSPCEHDFQRVRVTPEQAPRDLRAVPAARLPAG